ncbi:DUF3035 domain-containing protein [Citreimonas salinaria]|uniref:Beta-barrel assembly machine subunit BamF n=1 Tax=Citreimonas salinaria TaxID=321339 RepID=A0A1H3I0Q7_9RHOB|nr:DUF3035 domain-containing protein [Citreimonas salinaria]SDY20668.1 Beta-barrel assembly machine subunit BamF [Citreimonas salinaria]
MRAARLLGVLAFGALFSTLAACGDRDIGLRDLRSFDRSPEEFGIVPNRPLELPETTALPAPTPGGANRTDLNPKADAVAALGGNPAATVARGAAIPAQDATLVSAASRFGRDAGIRAELAADDLAFRQRQSLFTWSIVPRDDYAAAYRSQTLDAYRWLEVYRRAGARTPTAPPEG